MMTGDKEASAEVVGTHPGSSVERTPRRWPTSWQKQPDRGRSWRAPRPSAAFRASLLRDDSTRTAVAGPRRHLSP